MIVSCLCEDGQLCYPMSILMSDLSCWYCATTPVSWYDRDRRWSSSCKYWIGVEDLSICLFCMFFMFVYVLSMSFSFTTFLGLSSFFFSSLLLVSSCHANCFYLWFLFFTFLFCHLFFHVWSFSFIFMFSYLLPLSFVLIKFDGVFFLSRYRRYAVLYVSRLCCLWWWWLLLFLSSVEGNGCLCPCGENNCNCLLCFGCLFLFLLVVVFVLASCCGGDCSCLPCCCWWVSLSPLMVVVLASLQWWRLSLSLRWRWWLSFSFSLLVIVFIFFRWWRLSLILLLEVETVLVPFGDDVVTDVLVFFDVENEIRGRISQSS